ncbi:MAG: hypothetical protein ACE5FU_00615 [Nitrospinota bacterium]
MKKSKKVIKKMKGSAIKVSTIDLKVIGYFAYNSDKKVVCTEKQACIISGSETGMENLIGKMFPHDTKKCTVKKTRFGEIKNGLHRGAAYAFDEESYLRFFPLAQKVGFDIQQADFESQKKSGSKFFTVQIT